MLALLQPDVSSLNSNRRMQSRMRRSRRPHSVFQTDPSDCVRETPAETQPHMWTRKHKIVRWKMLRAGGKRPPAHMWTALNSNSNSRSSTQLQTYWVFPNTSMYFFEVSQPPLPQLLDSLFWYIKSGVISTLRVCAPIIMSPSCLATLVNQNYQVIPADFRLTFMQHFKAVLSSTSLETV
jgi:hypothetical protein